MSATTRTVLDSIRTFVIWIFSLAISWEKISNRTIIQVIGFSILMLGMFLYNDVFVRPLLIRKGLLRRSSVDDFDVRPIIRDMENESGDAVIPTMNNPTVQRGADYHSC